MDKFYRIDTYIRVKYFKTEQGAIRYAKRFNTSYKEVTDQQEIIWAKKQLKIITWQIEFYRLYFL